MRLKRILEAVAERICCPEAHRSVWRNWILEGAHRTFGSQTLDRAASQPISKAGRPAIHPRQNPLPVEKDLDRCCLPCSDSAIPSVGRIQASYAVIHMQGRMTNPDLKRQAPENLIRNLPVSFHKRHSRSVFYSGSPMVSTSSISPKIS